ncbi:hypothetical protein KBD81_00270 [Candidatus Woesebacteria bacterium]|nr:hypothetical protein [Candidatus Woesebacteria bacterium]
MEIIILLGVIFGIIYFAFSSTFSPIPFFPTNRKDIPLIIDAMNLSNNQIVFDLGAGSGRVIFAAARKAHELGLDTKFVAIDINIVLNVYMQLRKLFHPNGSNIEIVAADLFKYDYKKAMKKYEHAVFYMYVSPWYTDPMTQVILDTKKPASIISYYYPVKMLRARAHIEGENDLYTYKV